MSVFAILLYHHIFYFWCHHQNARRSIDDPADFQLLTDCVLKDVEVSKDPAMAPAQALVRRIRTRDLYAFVDE
jgi:hypothetical protein